MARTPSKDVSPSVYSVVKRFARSSKGTQVRDGLPYPLGASWDGESVNFAVFSANATKVELCLFDELGKEEVQRMLPEFTNEIWHGYVVGL
jgi:isoamylase